MKFQIENSSSVPVVRQIQQQIRLAVAMGVLKKGDILPSVREAEKETGINRGQVHRAYLALQNSGLLSLAPGNRIAVAISAVAPDSVNKKCLELANEITKRTRRIGVSPVAFARFLSRNVQENERKFPFIAYIDQDKERALKRAEQVSKLWHASILGLSLDEFKRTLNHGNKLRKILVNHLGYDYIRRLARGRTVDIIPIEICYTKQTVRELEQIRASSILVLLPNHARSGARFIAGQLRKLMKCSDVSISWMTLKEVPDFERLLKDSKYDRILISPGARGKVPVELLHSSRILLLQMELDPEDLEIARIRAGVIV
jgi:DNA-binding transcriptional regulator YhcF (GntR family)